MAKDKLSTSESGIAHLGLILAVVLVLGITAFAAFRVMSSNNDVAQQDDTSQTASEDGGDLNDDGSSDDTAQQQNDLKDNTEDPSENI